MVCAGIIKHSKKKKNYEDDIHSDNLIIWNPVTGEYKILSKTGSHKECYNMSSGLFQLYCTSSDDDYKLLRVTPEWRWSQECHVYMYSLKSDSWRKVEHESKVNIRPTDSCRDDWKSGKDDRKRGTDDWKPGTTALLNEKLYFLNGYISVISFDAKTEKFTQIETPFEAKFSLSFFVLRGCIHLLCAHKYYWGLELWRMEGDGDWMKVGPAFPWFLEPLQWMIKNWLRNSESSNDFVSANRYASLDKSSIWSIDMKKHTERSWTFLEYVETIVSPNQYTK